MGRTIFQDLCPSCHTTVDPIRLAPHNMYIDKHIIQTFGKHQSFVKLSFSVAQNRDVNEAREG